MTKRSYIKTCRCGNALRGFDTLGLTCSECLCRNLKQEQEQLLDKETRDLYALARETKEKGEKYFKYGICYFKVTKKGFKKYHTMDGKVVIDKKYKFDEEK